MFRLTLRRLSVVNRRLSTGVKYDLLLCNDNRESCNICVTCFVSTLSIGWGAEFQGTLVVLWGIFEGSAVESVGNANVRRSLRWNTSVACCVESIRFSEQLIIVVLSNSVLLFFCFSSLVPCCHGRWKLFARRYLLHRSSLVGIPEGGAREEEEVGECFVSCEVVRIVFYMLKISSLALIVARAEYVTCRYWKRPGSTNAGRG